MTIAEHIEMLLTSSNPVMVLIALMALVAFIRDIRNIRWSFTARWNCALILPAVVLLVAVALTRTF
jgi:hypothetical protein